MKIELESKIKDLIEGFRGSVITLNDDIKAAVDKWRGFARENGHDPALFQKSAFKEIDTAREDTKKYGILLNQELGKVVEKAKQLLAPGAVSRPADYAAKTGNALQFLSYQIDTLTDDAAFAILKDFADDYAQMQLFRGFIESRHKMVGTNGEPPFPKTFGKLDNLETITNALSEIEQVAKDLFTQLAAGETITFGNTGVPLAIVTYEEVEGEQTILELAKDIEKMAADL